MVAFVLFMVGFDRGILGNGIGLIPAYVLENFRLCLCWEAYVFGHVNHVFVGDLYVDGCGGCL